ncbi:MAG: rhomboid family intramembrane serine protease [Proteobacteria bacterium]|nr:rhomboid family intramembrane serine protease [Pseudomonadota bacterium]
MDSEIPWTLVFRSPAPGPCDDRRFVLLALDIPSELRREDGLYGLYVAPGDGGRALAELERYAHENRPQPRPVPPRLHKNAIPGALAYALVLFLLQVASTRSLLGHDWFGDGVLDGARLRAGELWRAVTALTLHGDLAHLLANLGFGALFGGLASRVYGAGVGWLLVLLAAAAANVLNGLWMPAGRVSLGASTAVFAALGALAVHRWPAATRRARLGLRGGTLVAALVLLALLGTGDAHTDVAAHALGFGCGVLGALPLRRRPPPESPAVQAAAGLAAVAIVALAWALAYWM